MNSEESIYIYQRASQKIKVQIKDFNNYECSLHHTKNVHDNTKCEETEDNNDW